MAVWFIINTFFVNVFDVHDVWYVLDALMFAGLVLARLGAPLCSKATDPRSLTMGAKRNSQLRMVS